MACTLCTNGAATFLMWIPIDANGDPDGGVSAFVTIPPFITIPVQGQDDVVLLNSTGQFPIPSNVYGSTYSFFLNTVSPAGGPIDDILDGLGILDFAATKYKFIEPGAGEDEDTSTWGDCNQVAGPDCVERLPCRGSVKLQIELTDAKFGKKHYGLVCEESFTYPLEVGNPPVGYDSDAEDAHSQNSNTQRPAGHPDDGQGNDDLSKIAIEVAMPACGCYQFVGVEIQDANGNNIRIHEPTTNLRMQLILAVAAGCSMCEYYIPTGLCCWEDEQNRLCCKENVTESECEQLAVDELYFGWAETNVLTCEDCPVAAHPNSNVENPPQGEYGECEEPN